MFFHPTGWIYNLVFILLVVFYVATSRIFFINCLRKNSPELVMAKDATRCSLFSSETPASGGLTLVLFESEANSTSTFHARLPLKNHFHQPQGKPLSRRAIILQLLLFFAFVSSEQVQKIKHKLH